MDAARKLQLADECDRWAAVLEVEAEQQTNPEIRARKLDAAAGARRDAARLRTEVSAGQPADPRTLDRDGFAVGTEQPAGSGLRPGVGLSSCVQRGDDIGVVVGLEPTGDGLLLHVAWLTDGRTSQQARRMAMRAHADGVLTAEQVPAEGLVALDVAITSPLVEQWKALDRQATRHMNLWAVVGSNRPCLGCDAPTCTYVTDVSREMRALYAQMSAAERALC
jgi:hypothetical protein